MKNCAADFQDLSLQFSKEDLVLATNQFSSERLLGKGSHGSVYRGRLRDGYEVAVKVLPVKQGHTDVSGFADEIVVLSRYRHPNLVTLMGYGISQDSTFLVYELLAGGDVASRLLACKRRPFGWAARVEAARGACYGLSYLHGSTPRAFHRDVKSANILLDRTGNAKLADFGLAGIASSIDGDIACERVSGTPGYACPEYVRTGRISEGSEVFSFGVVLLELLLNLRAAVMGSGGSTIFPIFQTVQPQSTGAQHRTLAALDATAQWPATLAAGLAQLALRSIAVEQQMRPGFRGLAEELGRLAEEDFDTGLESLAPSSMEENQEADMPTKTWRQASMGCQDSLDRLRFKEEELPTKTWHSKHELPATKTWDAAQEAGSVTDKDRDFGLDLPPTCSLAATKQFEPPTKTWYSVREEPPTKTWLSAQQDKMPLLNGLSRDKDENKSEGGYLFAKAVLKNLSLLRASAPVACNQPAETVAGHAGRWRNSQGVGISVCDGRFTTDHGETGSVDWQSSTECSLQLDGEICHGRLAADGALHWSDGDVWKPEEAPTASRDSGNELRDADVWQPEVALEATRNSSNELHWSGDNVWPADVALGATQNSSNELHRSDGNVWQPKGALEATWDSSNELHWSDRDVWQPGVALAASRDLGNEPASLRTGAFEGRWTSKSGQQIFIRNAKVTVESEVLGTLSSPDGRRCTLEQVDGSLRRGWLAPDGSVRWCDRDVWCRGRGRNAELDAVASVNENAEQDTVASLRFEADPCSKTQDEIKQTWFQFLSERKAWNANPAELQCTPVQHSETLRPFTNGVVLQLFSPRRETM